VQHQAFSEGYVQRLAQSDRETEEDFVAYFGELLAIKLRPRLHAADLVEDVIQETFLRVLKKLRNGGILDPEALGGFVNSVCNNILFEVYRQQSRMAEPPEDRASEEIPADTTLVAESDRNDVRQVLSAMSEKDRKIIRWLFFEERDKAEICRTLGVDREYLRVLLHRAKLRFRADWIKHIETKSVRPSPYR
jgi:RNA polymerase sigma-70 factor (ECF subfamily)